MQDEVEDGELIESDAEASSPSQNGTDTLKSNFWHGVPVSGGGCELGYMRTLNSKIMTSRRRPEGLPSSESESEELSDRSDDEKPVKRRRFASSIQQNSVFRNSDATGGLQSIPEQDCSNVGNKSCKQQRNNIWASVVQDQILSSEMSGWTGLEQAFNSDRNVESYNYLRAKENNVIASVPTFKLENPVIETQQEVIPDIGDIETFGTSSKNCKKKSVPNESCKEKDTPGVGRPWLKRNHRGECHGAVHNRIGSRGFDPHKERGHIRVTSADEPSAIVLELMRVLREPDNMKDTFARVVETVGVEEALKFLYKTEDLEAAGGLMTLDGCRRRTPGGVYLYLVKSDVSKEQQNLIFQYQNLKQQKRRLKAERSKKLATQRRIMEVALGLDTTEEDAATMTTSVKANKHDLLKPGVEEMEEDEANGEDCLTNPDPSTKIELDFA